jgi:choline dehydrogenase-like flavoprotein
MATATIPDEKLAGASQIEDSQETTCCIAGGGPGGMMLALLLARRGVQVTLLEAHKDFDREFRGDTLHPSISESARWRQRSGRIPKDTGPPWNRSGKSSATLARLGTARAYALQGDTAQARTAYQDFFAYWKDADPDIPVLKQAQGEYAKLK